MRTVHIPDERKMPFPVFRKMFHTKLLFENDNIHYIIIIIVNKDRKIG